MEPVALFNNWVNEMIRRRAGEGDQMDPWKDPPGWRTELKWGIATLVALALCAAIAPLLPVLWLGGRWSGRTGSR